MSAKDQSTNRRARALRALRSVQVVSAAVAALGGLAHADDIILDAGNPTKAYTGTPGAANGVYGQIYTQFQEGNVNTAANNLPNGTGFTTADPNFTPANFSMLQTMLNSSAPVAGSGYTDVNYANASFGNGAPFNVAPYSVAATDNIVARWSGYFDAGAAGGTFTFATRSDDGSVVYVDGVRMNGFQANNYFQGNTQRGGTIALTPGLHEIVVGYYEGTGGAGMQLLNHLTATNVISINSLQGVQATPLTAETTPGGGPDNITVAGPAANLNITKALTTQLGNLNFTAPTSTLTVQGSTVRFNQTNFSGGGPNVINLNASANSAFAQDYALGRLIDNGQLTTVNKTGGHSIILDNTVSANTAGNTTFNINGGGIALVGATGADPAGGAAINLNAAPNTNVAQSSLTVSAKSGNRYTYPGQITITDDATIRAQRFGAGVANGIVSLSNPNGLSIPAGKTLRLAMDNGYTLDVEGPVTGGGTLRVTGERAGQGTGNPSGTVNLNAGTSVNSYTGETVVNVGTVNINSPIAGTSNFIVNSSSNTALPGFFNMNGQGAPTVNANRAVAGSVLTMLNGTYNAAAAGSLNFNSITTPANNNAGAHVVNYNVPGAAGGRAINLTTTTGTLPANGTAGVQLNLSGTLTDLGGDTFNVPANHIINVQSAATGALLTRGGNLNVSPLAILGGVSPAAINAVQNLGTAADLYAGASGTWGTNTVVENITLGTGTPWKGLSPDRSDRRLQNVNVTLNSPVEFKSFQSYNSNPTLETVTTGTGGRLLLGNGTNPGTVNILAGPNGPQEVTFQGYNLIQTGGAGLSTAQQTNTANFSGVSKFIIAPGAVVQTDTTNAFGGAGGSAKPTVEVQSGGMLDPGVGNITAGSEAGSINTDVLFRAGSTLLLNDNGNLNGTGTITAEPGTVYRLTGNQPLSAPGIGQGTGSVPGVIVRLANNNFNFLDENFDDGAVYVVRAGDRTLAGSLGLNGSITGTNFADITGVLTNDNTTRRIRNGSTTASNVISLNVGTSGATLAASVGTTFNIGSGTTTESRLNMNAGDNPIQIGSTVPIDGLAKNGIVAWTGQNTTNGPMATWRSGPVNIVAGTFRHSGGGADYVVSGGTGTTTVNPGTTFESNTGALIDSRLVIMNGGTARFTATSTPSASSIEGGGSLILGNTTGTGTIPFATGQNNLSTTFSGVISQPTGFTGSLTKVGTGTLTLTGANTYGGGTRVNAGMLILNNTTGSGSGTGPVTVTSGASLGGIGTVGGNTAGNLLNILPGGRWHMGPTAGSALPDVGTLTVNNTGAAPGSGTNSTVLLSPGSNFNVDLDFDRDLYDQLKILGTVQLTDANLNMLVAGTPVGDEQITLIDNDAADPVAGTFAGLAEGSTVTVGGTPFTITYAGGDGNDVVLVGVPEPGAIGALGLAAAAALMRRRRRR